MNRVSFQFYYQSIRAVFTWLSKGIGFGFGFGFTTPFGWLVYLLWFWFYDSQVKTALIWVNLKSALPDHENSSSAVIILSEQKEER